MTRQITVQDAFLRLSSLCAASEHCTFEMEEKMRRWQMRPEDIDTVIERLTKGRYIDDERFCRAFVNDKVIYNRWGRKKVEQALFMKRIPQQIARRTLNEVDPQLYINALKPLIEAKRRSIKANSQYEFNAKLMRFALQRGFTMDIIQQVIDSEDF